MIKQKWVVAIDGKEINVEYSYSSFLCRTVLTVDGESFTVKGNPFGLGIQRREMIMLGGEQAILDVAKNGRATLICREGEVREI